MLKGNHYKVPDRAAFTRLLYAVHNIGGPDSGVEPADARGQRVNDAALQVASQLYFLMENGKPGVLDGVVCAVRLLAETSCADDPDVYAEAEIKKGLDGYRVEGEGAGLVLPNSVKKEA